MGVPRPLRIGATALASAGVITTGVQLTAIDVAHAAYGSVTATTAVNVRSGPSTSNRILGVLNRGQSLTQAGPASNGWVPVTWQGSTAYVYGQYLTGTSATTSPVASTPSTPVIRKVVGQVRGTTALMIRTSYTNHYNSEGDAPAGTIFDITGRQANGVAEIIWHGRVRWINARYIVPVGSTSGSSTLPAVVGTRYARVALDIRTASDSTSVTVGEVPAGTALKITGVYAGGRAQIVYNGAVRWVTAQWLTSTAPGTTSGSTGSTSTSSWAALMAGGSSGLQGLRPSATKIVNDVIAHFPRIRTIYGIRADSLPDHPSGHAVDLMLPNYRANETLGWTIANYYKAHAKALGVQYIIFHQHIWNIARDSEGWRLMADRGGDTANHMDHVHITTIWD
ncbi:SH3 domain-containing protein [Acidipropionibacterium timonense]|uniref:SH3 domain-containing protein n=1 Tax=Acidipropionibacterium timonense TaxID=2161818 RepID=UPI0010324F09|nr:SH3 domain-containing protein [Acidipropionibacterium timonense]